MIEEYATPVPKRPDFDLDPFDKALRWIRDEMKPLDISITYLLVLRLLFRREKVNQTAISEAFGFTQGGTSKVLKTLSGWETADGQKKGVDLVIVERNRFNRSKTDVRLTDRGHEVVAFFDMLLEGKNSCFTKRSGIYYLCALRYGEKIYQSTGQTDQTLAEEAAKKILAEHDK